MSKQKPFGVGAILCTKNSQAFTNAIIINETDTGHYVLLTDFGSIIHIVVEEISEYYSVSEHYLHAFNMGYPLLTISERIKHQIDLLTDALSVVKQLECFTKQP